MKRRLAVLVLAFTMVLTMSVSVFAAPSASGALGSSVLSMELAIAEGTEVPAATFTYSFAGQASDTVTAAQASSISKELKTLTTDSISDNKVIKNLALSDVFNLGTGATDKINLTHAGEWVYTVSQASSYVNDEKNILTPDTKTYTLRIYVTNDGTSLKADTVTVDKTGTSDNDQAEDGKVDPTPSTPGGPSNFKFENSFYRIVDTNNGGDPENPDSNKNVAFSLKKAVSGTYADKTLDFPFAVTITYPSTVPEADRAAFETSGNDGNMSEALSGLDLHNDEYFSMKKLPVGTKITIVETQDRKYYGSVSGTANLGEQDKGANVTVTNMLVGENGANVVVTNRMDEDEVTPTGIIINNLPYILLIGLALGGIVLFSRKRRYE